MAGLVLLYLLSCGEPGGGPADPRPTNPVQGLITSIDDTSLELRTDGGRSYRFRIADPTVPVKHLRVHLRDRLPVLITWRAEGDDLMATTIADAPA